jgi:transcription elongation factor Elf1
VSEPIAAERTKDITCPYCGHLRRDYWDVDFGFGWDMDANVRCYNCDKAYSVTCIVDVCYTSRPNP